MRRTLGPLALVLAGTLIEANQVSGWNSKITHKDLSLAGAQQSVLDNGYLSNLGLKDGINSTLEWSGGQEGTNKEIKKWIQEGANFEDGSWRFFNHFHDPLKEWSAAGLNDYVFGINFRGGSSVLWAQNSGTFSRGPNADWSWESVRALYYQALIAPTKAEREAYLAQTFRGIGHLIHLIQDMAQPAHVRNDAHPEDAFTLGEIRWFERLENWAAVPRANRELARSFMANPMFPTIPSEKFEQAAEPGQEPTPILAPITAFWDANVFTKDSPAPPTSTDVGLAEYVNGNFFSDSTIGAPVGSRHYYRFPSADPQNYYRCEKEWFLVGWRRYLSKAPCPTDGSPLEPSLVESFFYTPVLGAPVHDYLLNDFVYEDYARKLLPLAVGYSAAFINYFFRDDIEITPPDRAVYGLTGPTGAFQQIKLKARASLTTGDALTNGQIHLAIVYRPALEDPYRANLTTLVPRGDFVSIVVPEQNGLRAIPADTPVELTFDLGNTPLPLWATDVRIQVVYKGAIGSWPDAVAVGAKDLSEPTPINFINTMDYSCLNGNYVVSGSPEAVAQAGTNTSWDIYPHRMQNVYVKFSSVAAPQLASSSLYDAFLPALDPATYGRTFILIDSTVYFSTNAQIVRLDGRDGNPHLGTYTVLLLADPLINQTAIIDGQETGIYAGLSLVRGVPYWYGVAYPNTSYPDGTTCSEAAVRNAQPNVTGPVAVQFP